MSGEKQWVETAVHVRDSCNEKRITGLAVYRQQHNKKHATKAVKSAESDGAQKHPRIISDNESFCEDS